MKNKLCSSKIILFFVLALFIVYECSMMFAGVDDVADSITLFGTTSFFPLFLLLFSLLYLFYAKEKVTNKTCSYLVVFVIIYFLTIFGTLIYSLNSRIVLFSSILPLCFWLIGDSLNKNCKDATLSLYIPICFVVLVAFFLLNFDITLLLDKVFAAVNASYTVVYLLPFLLLNDKRIVRIVAILLAILVTLMSLKRGGMLSLGIGLTLYLIVYVKVSLGKLVSFRGLVIAIIAVIVISYLVIYFNDSMEGLVFNRFVTLEQDEGSGRGEIYKEVQEMISHSSIIGYVFGHGWGGVARDSSFGLSAHNDFLEIIYDFGYLAFFLYVIFLVRLTRRLFKMLKNNHPYSPALSASLSIFLVNSLVSHIFIYSWYMIMFTFFWGFVIRETNNDIVYNEINNSELYIPDC